MSFRAPLSAGVPAWSTSRSKSDPGQADIDLGRDCEVTIEMDVDGPHAVVSVVGRLGRSGGALLSAVLEYMRERESGPVALDLRGVSHADRHGLAPVIESGAVLTGTSPAVDRVLAGATRTTNTEGRTAGADTGRLPSSSKPVPEMGSRQPDRGPPLDLVQSTMSDPTN
jgi:hypothetical protein